MQSVVEEFSILYTDRLTQRDKRWVDGTLRYYRFNSKLEVVNEDQWVVKTDFRQNATFEEGAQYTVNGLLIEIVESTSVYERDISGLFKKPSGAAEPNKMAENKYRRRKQFVPPMKRDTSIENIRVKQKHEPLASRPEPENNRNSSQSHNLFSEAALNDSAPKPQLQATPEGTSANQRSSELGEPSKKLGTQTQENSLHVSQDNHSNDHTKLIRIPNKSTNLFENLKQGNYD